MTKTMRAVDIENGAGPASSLYINDATPRPVPTASDLLIRVKTFGLNRADTLQREGKYPVPPNVTRTLGLEFAGTIEEIGSPSAARAGDQGEWNEGDEVFGLCYGGAYAEYVIVDAGMVVRKPEELGWECCGGLCEVWFTALQALYLVGGFEAGKTKSVLWHAGASGVSIAGIQLTHAAHPSSQTPPRKVFVTARQDPKITWCVSELNASGGANTATHPTDWPSQIKQQNNDNGIDLLIDFIGAPVFSQNLEVLNRDGRVVQLGVMGGVSLPAGADISAFVRKRVRFEGSTLRSRDTAYQRRLRDLFVEKALPGLIKGRGEGKADKDGVAGFENIVDFVCSWKDIGKAHERLEGNQTKGKVVCWVD